MLVSLDLAFHSLSMMATLFLRAESYVVGVLKEDESRYQSISFAFSFISFNELSNLVFFY